MYKFNQCHCPTWKWNRAIL